MLVVVVVGVVVVVAVTVVVGALAGDGVVVAVLLSLQLPKSIRDWTSTDGFGDDAYIRVLRLSRLLVSLQVHTSLQSQLPYLTHP